MIILPLDRPIDWRRPPWVVFGLLLVNVLVFAVGQRDDAQAQMEAFSWYYDSGLAEIELPHYRDWLVEHGDRSFAAEFGDSLDEPDSPWLPHLLANGAFQQELAHGAIIAEGDDDYPLWQEKRLQFEHRLEESATFRWGLRPFQNEAPTWLTHMFLHGGIMHLVGNMLFLVTVGFLVEIVLGSTVLLAAYLAAGIGAAGLFVAVNASGGMPLVGASGAIAGLMGMLPVVYGRQKIGFFFSIGVYFDYVKAPALILLPAWLGYELFQFYTAHPHEPVAYSAHVGGLLVGAGVASVIRLGTNWIDHDVVGEREHQETFQRDEAEVRQAIARLDPEAGRAALRRLRNGFPGDRRVLQLQYEWARLQPASDEIHQAARAILRLPGEDAATRDWLRRTWNDYRERARPRPRLDAATTERMAAVLLATGELEQAEVLLRPALKQPARFDQPQELLVRLVTALTKAGERQRAYRWYQQIIRLWPDSEAAQRAGKALERAV